MVQPAQPTWHCPSGTKNLSSEFKTNWIYEEKTCGTRSNIYHPCCSNLLALTWEMERTAYQQDDTACCISFGILSRITHVVSWVGNIVSTVAAPVICAGGTVVAAGSCCAAGALYTSECCCRPCAPESMTASVHKTAEKSRNLAINALANSAVISATLAAIAVTDTVKLPVNIIVPELADNYGCQQELNLKFNQMTQGKDYTKKQ